MGRLPPLYPELSSVCPEAADSIPFRYGRRDKSGGYARTRRQMKRLLREGYIVRSILVASFTLPNRTCDGKGALSIYRDGIVRVSRRKRRPDLSYQPEEVCDD